MNYIYQLLITSESWNLYLIGDGDKNCTLDFSDHKEVQPNIKIGNYDNGNKIEILFLINYKIKNYSDPTQLPQYIREYLEHVTIK